MELKVIKLTVKQRQYLKGLAHDLDPVVMIGDKGLTDAVVKEINTALTAHELIKIRVLGEDRELRNSLIEKICEASQSSLVQHIGKILVYYRPNEMKQKIQIK